MKIELKYPYNEDWRLGYLLHNKSTGRNNVHLRNSDNDLSTTSYARYLMSVHLGRYLEDHEHVDHINDIKSDDRIDNLQILTVLENNYKSAPPKTIVSLQCPFCKKEFKRQKRQTHLSKPNNKATYCSRSCSASVSNLDYIDISNNVLSIYKNKE